MIVMEYFEGGNLLNYLVRRNCKINEERVVQIIHHLATALYYLHVYGIIHRDIKLQNILMTDDTQTAIPKLIDFGFSHILGPNQNAALSVGIKISH
jgi:serine/threonine protein kinase